MKKYIYIVLLCVTTLLLTACGKKDTKTADYPETEMILNEEENTSTSENDLEHPEGSMSEETNTTDTFNSVVITVENNDDVPDYVYDATFDSKEPEVVYEYVDNEENENMFSDICSMVQWKRFEKSEYYTDISNFTFRNANGLYEGECVRGNLVIRLKYEKNSPRIILYVENMDTFEKVADFTDE